MVTIVIPIKELEETYESALKAARSTIRRPGRQKNTIPTFTRDIAPSLVTTAVLFAYAFYLDYSRFSMGDDWMLLFNLAAIGLIVWAGGAITNGVWPKDRVADDAEYLRSIDDIVIEELFRRAGPRSLERAKAALES